MLYQAGPRVREIFRQIPETGTDADYDIAKQKLKAYFDPQKNRRYEVYRFRQTAQEPKETLDQFHTRLRTLSETCEFADLEFEIEQQIIVGGTSTKIRERALRDPTFDTRTKGCAQRKVRNVTIAKNQIILPLYVAEIRKKRSH